MLRLYSRVGSISPTMFTAIRQCVVTTSMTTALRRQTMATVAAAANQTKVNDDQFEKAWTNAKPYSSIPGPSRFQLVRLFLPGGDLHNQPNSAVGKYFRRQYGDMVKVPGMLGQQDILLTFDPKIYEIVYRTEGNWPIRRSLVTFEYYRKHRRPEVFGGIGGLLSDQGETWANMRKSVSPVMLKPKAVKSYVPVVDQVTREFVSKIHTMRDAKGEMPVDFSNELGLWAIESIGVIALDKRLGTLERNRNNEADMVIKAVRDFLLLSYIYETQPTVWRYYKTKKFETLMEAFETITNLGTKYVNEAVAVMDKMEKDGIEGNGLNEESVLQKLLRIDRRYAILMVFDMLFAGIDTTAASSAIFLYHLAKNPDKQAKLSEEIKQMLPEIDSPLTEETLNNMPYLRACIKESMRLQPLIPGHLRAAGQDIILNGYQIPKMTNVAMTSTLSTEESHFTESNTYLPERWLRNTADLVAPASDPSPFAFLPFGFGPRSCVGRRFAEMEIEILMTRILREYRVEWHHGPMEYAPSLVNTPCSPLRYRLIRHDAK